jgi:hypothetical protein
MSLKALHAVFIVLSIVLAAWFGVWALRDFGASANRLHLAMGAASLAGTILLAWYLVKFLQKMRRLPAP